jgi:deoxyribodipyrimidine photolyase-related protein
MNNINLIFPHQLFQDSVLIQNNYPIYLIEEFLFFKQYPFHKQKIVYHRASMRFYADFLASFNRHVTYVNAIDPISDVRELIHSLHKNGCDEIHYINTCDDWLEKRIKKQADKLQLTLKRHQSPAFINSLVDLKDFFKPTKKKFFQTSYYKQQRIKHNLLIDEDNKPIGGKWSFDQENRKPYPTNKQPPKIIFPASDKYFQSAIEYVEQYFNHHLGELPNQPIYPHNFTTAQKWLKNFLIDRFDEFGTYEDAIVKSEAILNHSVLTPMLNIGLLTPSDVLTAITTHCQDHQIPINSQEGFVRQIIGWREFIRGIYLVKGTQQRNHNFWGFKNDIPASFYNGSTGIEPFDDSIKKVLKTGYCHHIERLMILGSFMLLCEISPNAVYRWFMELFIDSYDWVMVPNVYGMSQFADGGLMSTKPYISGSNYIIKMSDYKKGEWCEIWDSLFWRFMNTKRDFFLKNPRLGMLVKTFDKMPAEKQNKLMTTANSYLSDLKRSTH